MLSSRISRTLDTKVIQSGLVAYYHFQRKSGATLLNLAPSYSEYPLSLNSSTVNVSDGITLTTTGTPPNMTTPSVTFLDYTIEVSFRIIDLSIATQTIVYFHNTSDGTKVFKIWYDQATKKFKIWNKGIYTVITSNNLLTDTNWHTIQIINNSTTFKLFFDGVLIQTQASSVSSFIPSMCVLGSYFDSAYRERMNGNVKFLRYYNRALSDVEVDYNFKMGNVVGM
jgi:hypothetical protein